MKRSRFYVWRGVVFRLFLAVVLFILLLLLKSSVWFLNHFDEVEFSAVVYQLISPMKGTGTDILNEYLHSCLYHSISLSIIFFLVYNVYDLLSKKLLLCFDIKIGKKEFHFEIGKQFFFISKTCILSVSILILCFYIKKQLVLIGIPKFIENLSNASELYEQEYVNPGDKAITFPQEKRNLLLIYMESMETTYASIEAGGGKPDNYIPRLTKLANENLFFSDDSDLGGANACDGTGWTMAGLLASSSGVNYKLPIDGNEAGEYKYFLKGLITLGDILEDAGYQNYFMCGSDSRYAGRRDFYEQHGNYNIFDYYSAKEDGIISDDYYEFWGMEDQYLYKYAQEKLTEIASNQEPFNFTMLTVDTHHPEGYICKLCKDEYSEQYANAIACADRQLCEFIGWVEEQEWYEKTTVIITGDHRSMVTGFWNDIGNYERRIYNCFMNVPGKFSAECFKNRTFSILDMFPTILAAMNVRIEGERLGLGTNLFSGNMTLPEKMGWDEFNRELELYSNYYINNFVIKERPQNP